MSTRSSKSSVRLCSPVVLLDLRMDTLCLTWTGGLGNRFRLNWHQRACALTLSNLLPTCLPAYLPTSLPTCNIPTITIHYLPIHPSVYRSIYMSIIYSFEYPSITFRYLCNSQCPSPCIYVSNCFSLGSGHQALGNATVALHPIAHDIHDTALPQDLLGPATAAEHRLTSFHNLSGKVLDQQLCL